MEDAGKILEQEALSTTYEQKQTLAVDYNQMPQEVIDDLNNLLTLSDHTRQALRIIQYIAGLQKEINLFEKVNDRNQMVIRNATEISSTLNQFLRKGIIEP